ncbi:MAG: hypothetical protein ACXV6K_09500, partial [Halobacteriota archaeon]
TGRLASNATIVVIVLFLSRGKAASPDVCTIFGGGLFLTSGFFSCPNRERAHPLDPIRRGQ